MKVLLEEKEHSIYADEQEEKENREHLRSGYCKLDAAVRVNHVAETRGCRFEHVGDFACLTQPWRTLGRNRFLFNLDTSFTHLRPPAAALLRTQVVSLTLFVPKLRYVDC
jgi:hypothetical protein